MDSRVDYLLGKLEKSPRYLIAFGDALSENFKYFACIEGDDEPYYSRAINSVISDGSVAFVRCNGRDNVISLLNILSNHADIKYRNSLYYGFIDHDYYFNFENKFTDRLYVTPTYSFENFYTSISSFNRLLSAIFHTKGFGEYKEDYSRCISSYTEMRNKFINHILDVDCVLRAASIMQKSGIKASKKTYADNVKLSRCNIELNLFECEWPESVKPWLTQTLDFVTIDSLYEADDYYKNMTPDDLNKCIRGKYIFEFYQRYLRKLLIDATIEPSPKCFIKRKINQQLNCVKSREDEDIEFYRIKVQERYFDESIASLAAFADIPSCLTLFIGKMRLADCA